LVWGELSSVASLVSLAIFVSLSGCKVCITEGEIIFSDLLSQFLTIFALPLPPFLPLLSSPPSPSPPPPPPHPSFPSFLSYPSVLSMIVPVYNAELAPSSLRGRLVSLNQLAITAGLMVSPHLYSSTFSYWQIDHQIIHSKLSVIITIALNKY